MHRGPLRHGPRQGARPRGHRPHRARDEVRGETFVNIPRRAFLRVGFVRSLLVKLYTPGQFNVQSELVTFETVSWNRDTS